MSVSTENFYKKHLTNLAEWKKLGEANIFPPGSRLELINGEIIEMAPIGSNHSGHINRLNQLLARFIANQAIVSVHNPVQLGDLSEPEPDLMLLKPNADFYSSQHPDASHVLLLIEVADSSLKFDQNQKLRLYALHNIPEYWLLNVNDACLEVYSQPHNGLYAEKTTLRSGDEITLSQLSNINIKIADIL
ncbi:MAG: Uma2 family endonuclease [Methylococcales bacterium]|nr:Uma2 family endonuclease [Methylococcales bacterium]